MTAAHLIEDLCFEIDFASEEEAFEAQERLMRFAQVRAQQVIGEVFDEVLEPDAVLRLERLEVDVGTVAAEDFEDRFAERLREALRTLLEERRSGAASSVGLEDSAAAYAELEFSAGPGRSTELGSDEALESRSRWASSAEPGKSTGLGSYEVLESRSRWASSVEPGKSTGLGSYGALESRSRWASSVEPGRPTGLDSSAVLGPPVAPGQAVGLGQSAGLGTPASSADALTTGPRAELDWLLHFIEHGFLPWHAPAHVGREVQALAARVLENRGAELARALRAVPVSQRRLIFRRLVAQFPSQWLAGLGRQIGLARQRASVEGAQCPVDTRDPAGDGAEVSAAEWVPDAVTFATDTAASATDTATFTTNAAASVTDTATCTTDAAAFAPDAATFATDTQTPARARRAQIKARLGESLGPGVARVGTDSAAADGAEDSTAEWTPDAATFATNAAVSVTDTAMFTTDAAAFVPDAATFATDTQTPARAPRAQIEALLGESLGSGAARVGTGSAVADGTQNSTAEWPPDAATFATDPAAFVPATETFTTDTQTPALARRAQIEALLGDSPGSGAALVTSAAMALTVDTWRSVLRDDAEWLEETLSQRGSAPRMRRRLAEVLPEEVVADVLELWLDPTHIDIVLATIGARTASLTDERANTGAPAGALNAGRLLATLTYILVEGGAWKFNESDYRRSVAGQISRYGEQALVPKGPAARPTPTPPPSASTVNAADVASVSANASPMGPRSPFHDAARSHADGERVEVSATGSSGAGAHVKNSSAAVNAVDLYDTRRLYPNGGPVEISVARSGTPESSATPAVSHTTSAEELHETLDGPHEALARTQARAQIEAILGETPESDFRFIASVPVTADTWRSVLRDDTPWLRETLLRLGRGIRVRRRLAAALPEEVVAEVLGLWLGPPQVDIVLTTIDVSPSPLTHAPASTTVSREALRTARLLATLTYILVDGGGLEFSESGYRRSLADQTARGTNEPLELKGVAARPTPGSAPSAEHDEKSTSMTELSGADAVTAADAANVTVIANPTGLHSPFHDPARFHTDGQRVEVSATGLRGAGAMSAADVANATAIVDDTRSHHPLYDDGPLHADRSSVEVSAARSRALADSDMNQPTQAVPPDELHEALDGTHEASARSRARAQIETILKELPESEFPFSASALAASLPAAADIWRHVLRDDAHWLKETLLRLGRGVRTRRRLAAVLPEEVVAEVLGLWLEPAQVDIVLATMDVDLAPFSASMDVSRAALRAARLLTTLTYILVDGGATEFSESGYRARLTHQPIRERDEAVKGEGIFLNRRPHADAIGDAPPGTFATIHPNTNLASATTPDSATRVAHGSRPPSDAELVVPTAAHLHPNSDPMELAAARPNAQAVPEETTAAATVASADLRETPTRSQARAQIESVLSEFPESDVPAPASTPTTSLPMTAETWRSVLRNEAPWLKATLLRLGRRAHVRRRLAAVLPEEVVAEVLALWLSPAQVDAVLTTINVGTDSFTGERGNTTTPRGAAGLLATLTYILAEGGASKFSESEYRGSLANQTAHDRDDALPPRASSPENRAIAAAGDLSTTPDIQQPSGATAAIDARLERSTTAQSDTDPPAAATSGTSARPANPSAILSEAKPVVSVAAAHIEPDSKTTQVIALSPSTQADSEIPRAAHSALPPTAVQSQDEAERDRASVPNIEARAKQAGPSTLNTDIQGTSSPAVPQPHAMPADVVPPADLAPAPASLPATELSPPAIEATPTSAPPVPSPATQTRLTDPTADTTSAASGASLTSPEVDLLHHLRGAPTPNSPTESLRRAWRALLDQRSAAARHALSAALEYPGAGRRLVGLLATDDMANVLHWLRPTEAASALAVAAQVSELGQAPTDTPTRAVNESLLTELFEEGRTLNPERLAQRLTATLHAASASPDKQIPRTRSETMSPRGPTDPDGTQTRATAHPSPFRRPSAHTAAGSSRAQPATATDDAAVNQRIYIANAGVVIVGPYLPRLFSMLGLTNKESFTSLSGAHRAVHLIQYVVTGATSSPEPMLVLNKILCGLPISAPIPLDIDLRAQEQTAIEEMLAAIIAHWKAIGRTSIAGLRESFLQRAGRLESSDEAWRLRVESKCFDMLLDRLPWGYTMVKYPWMKRVLHVDWR